MLPRLKHPPQLLYDLLHGNEPRSNEFIKNICAYNMMFAFTSLGGNIDSSINQGQGPYVFCMHGQNYHMMRSLLPLCCSQPKFAQLYIHDSGHEILNRMHAIR